MPEKGVERLYGLPLEEFTQARNELAKELREQGERERADEVKQLRKASVAAWAVNQLARNEPTAMGKLLDAGKRLREAHEDVLAGKGRKKLEEAVGDERKAVERLAGRAERLLDGASTATLDRVRETLHAIATDDELRGEVEDRRVTRERKPAAFGGLGAGSGSRARAKTAPKAEPDDRRRELVEAARKELRRHRSAQRDAEKDVRGAKRRLERAEKAFREAESELEQARDEAAEAQESVEEAGRRVEDSERRLGELTES